jgi:hypothetical protein
VVPAPALIAAPLNRPASAQAMLAAAMYLRGVLL